jgi:probable HAF family extracellular repeat protein
LGGPDSIAFFVNESGQIAGASDVDFQSNPITGGPTVHPFLWDHGQMVDLADSRGAKFGGTYGTVSAMNNQGQVTGTMNLAGDLIWHSFLWNHGRMTDLGTLGGAIASALWMNEAGHVVGRSDVTEIYEACGPGNEKQLPHPFFWSDGAMVDLGLLHADTAGAAASINIRDQVVGYTTVCTHVGGDDSCDGSLFHPFLWENGTIVDLQTLILPGSDITLNEARYINDRGEIECTGVLPNGDQRVVLLVPDGDCGDGCDARIERQKIAAAEGEGRSSIVPINPKSGADGGASNSPRNRFGRQHHFPGKPAVSSN